MGQRLVLRWAEEQWGLAVPQLQAAEEALEQLKKEAEMSAIKLKDTRFTLEVGLGFRVEGLGLRAPKQTKSSTTPQELLRPFCRHASIAGGQYMQL